MRFVVTDFSIRSGSVAYFRSANVSRKLESWSILILLGDVMFIMAAECLHVLILYVSRSSYSVIGERGGVNKFFRFGGGKGGGTSHFRLK